MRMHLVNGRANSLDSGRSLPRPLTDCQLRTIFKSWEVGNGKLSHMGNVHMEVGRWRLRFMTVSVASMRSRR
jgi:hypothetical protein